MGFEPVDSIAYFINSLGLLLVKLDFSLNTALRYVIGVMIQSQQVGRMICSLRV